MGGMYLLHEVFLRMYLPLVLEVYNRQCINNLDFMAVDEIKKCLFGLVQS